MVRVHPGLPKILAYAGIFVILKKTIYMKKILLTLGIGILIIQPVGALALSPDFSAIPPACEIEGKILSVEEREAYEDPTWQELNQPGHYRLQVRITNLSNPGLRNSRGVSCLHFFRPLKKVIIKIPVGMEDEYGILEKDLYIRGQVSGRITGSYLTEYGVSVSPIGKSGVNKIGWLLIAATGGILIGIVVGRKTSSRSKKKEVK